jgi:hypothetical protein
MSVLWIGRQGIKERKTGNNPRNFTEKQTKTPAASRREQKIIAFSDKKNYNSDNSL